ncbi:MAG: hypothetical protein PSU94_15775 [Lacunisphaera sp.]|nr:hypothetical protein [Lacunisphaera sp.]
MTLRLYALVLSLAAVGLALALWREHATATELAARNTRLSRQIAGLNYEVKHASRQAAEFGQRAVELDSQLGSAKSRTTATESKQFQLTRELTETKSRLTERAEREVALMAELATLRQVVARPAVTDGNAAPSAEAAGAVTPDQRRIAELEQQLTRLLTRALAEPAAPAPAAEPAVAAPYQVVRVGPRNSFVVLDYGASDGARPGEILGLWRGTSPVARVQISDARPRFSLAQVLSATLKGQLQTGDLVLLTN